MRLAVRAEAGNAAALLLLTDAAQRYDWVAAVRYVDRARKAPGFAGESLVALVLRRAGEWQRALDHATLWYRAEPASEAAAEAYLRALIGSGNTKAAEDLLPRLLLGGQGTTAGRSNLHFLQAQLAKSEEASLAALRTALVENSDNVEALLAMFDLYFRRQDWQKARFYLKQAAALAPTDPETQRRARDLGASAP
jgi:tetratricopeptide (TPR) repeat protein